MANKHSPGQAQTILKAATVIVFRRAKPGAPEILMVRRAKSLAFAGSAVVFPGGKLEEADMRMADGNEEVGARIAAIRELLEETGLLLGIAQKPCEEDVAAARRMLQAGNDLSLVLKRFSWALDVEQLLPFARWVPTFKPGRIFDTRFYLVDIGTGDVVLTPDLDENTHLFWTTATRALSDIEEGNLKAIYPTRRNLERLALFENLAAARAQVESIDSQIISPWVKTCGDEELLCIPRNAGYPIVEAPLSQINID